MELPAELPIIRQKKSYKIELEAGKKYWWCSCGQTKTEPWCDGSHKGSGFKSVPFEVDETKIYSICACRHAANNSPFCDGTHKLLP